MLTPEQNYRILNAINLGDFETVTALANEVDEYGYPKYDFNADFFYNLRGSFKRVKTTVVEYVLSGLFNEEREYSERFPLNPEKNVFEWILFLARLKNEYGDPIIDFKRAVLDKEGNRSPNLFFRILTYNRWLCHSARRETPVNKVVLKYAFKYLPEVFDFQLRKYWPDCLFDSNIFAIIIGYYHPLEFYDTEFQGGEANPPLLAEKEILSSLNASLTLKVLKIFLELSDSQGRPILAGVDSAFLLTLAQDKKFFVPAITKNLINYVIKFFEGEELTLHINMSSSWKMTALNLLDHALSEIAKLKSFGYPDDFASQGIEEVAAILIKKGGKRYLELSDAERMPKERFIERKDVSPFWDRRRLQIKTKDNEPSEEEKQQPGIYYIYPQKRYGRPEEHYGKLLSSGFFSAPLSDDLKKAFWFLENQKNLRLLHQFAKKDLDSDLEERSNYLKMPPEKYEGTEEERDKFFLGKLRTWTGAILKRERKIIEEYIFLKWEDEKNEIVFEFKENCKLELRARLSAFVDENKNSVLSEEAQEKLIDQFFREKTNSKAYSDALQEMDTVIENLFRGYDAPEKTSSEYVQECLRDLSKQNFFLKLHRLEVALLEENEEEFIQKSKAQKYIEACYQDLEGLSKSLDTYKKFREFIKKYNSEPEDQNIILSSLTRKIREQLFFKDNIPQIVIAVTKLEEILDQVPQQELSILKRFPIVEPVKEALEEEFKEINEQAISLYQEVVKCCLNMQEDYDVLQEVQLKEDEAIQSFVRCSVLKVEAVLSQKKSFQDIRNEVCSIKTDSLNCVSVYKDIISNYGTGNLIKLKNIAQTILQDPGVSLEDKQNKLRAWRKFIIAITENRGNNEETFSFLKEYFLWRISNLSDQELGEVELIQILEQEKTSFEDLLKLEVNLKSVIDMQDYSRSVSLGAKRMAAMRSVWSAKIKIGKSGNPHFEEFANHTLMEARETLEKHRDNCGIRFLYALAVSVSSFLIYPFYICCRYRTFPLPTKGKMVLHDLEQSLNVNLAR
jgi:hypothetical protein